MTDKIMGIKSLQERMEMIENKFDHNHPKNVIEKMLIEKKIKDDQERDQKFDIIKKNYTEYVTTYVSDPMKHLTKLIEASVIWIEENGHKIMYLFDLTISGESKLQLCIDLILSIITYENIEFLKDTINHFVQILFPKKMEVDDKKDRIKDVKKKSKKKNFWTLRIR